jgi:hypothetical protein
MIEGMRTGLASQLADLDLDPIVVDPAGLPGLESLTSGYAMTEVGASLLPAPSCCSCCLCCCCCG